MKVIHTIACLKESSGGPSRSVSGLVSSLSKTCCLVELLSNDLALPPEMNVLPESKMVTPQLVPAVHLLDRKHINLISFYKHLSLLVNSFCPNIIHDHGLWLPTNYLVYRVAKKNNLKLVIHTRGMLEPWALKYRSWKKKVVLTLFQRKK